MKTDGTPYTTFTPYSVMWKRKYREEKIRSFRSEKLLINFVKTKPFAFPSLKEIGFAKTNFEISSSTANKKIIAGYHLTRNFPAVKGTSHLSVHLRFGTVSVGHLVKTADRLN